MRAYSESIRVEQENIFLFGIHRIWKNLFFLIIYTIWLYCSLRVCMIFYQLKKIYRAHLQLFLTIMNNTQANETKNEKSNTHSAQLNSIPPKQFIFNKILINI